MRRIAMLAVSALMAMAASAGLTTHLALDCREGVRIVSDEGVDLRYDADWYEGGNQARLTDNGVGVESGVRGTKHWAPTDGLAHYLQMSVVDSNGTEVGSAAADFIYVPSHGTVVIPEGMTHILADTFKGCDWLTSVTIPASVTNVSATAFAGCANISSATLPPVDSLSAVFPDSHRTLATVTVTGGESLPADFAAGCTGLTSVTLPETLTEIGVSAFSGCDGLTCVNVPSLSSWLGVAFADVAANPLHAGASLYLGGSRLTDLVVPEGATEIGPYAFAGLNVTSVTIPASVTNVPATAFAGCSNISSATLPPVDSLSAVFPDSHRTLATVTVTGGESLPADFAAGCTGLTSVTLPETLTEIGTSAFSGCDGLTRVNVPSLSSWLGVAFANVAANPLHAGASLYVGESRLTDLVVPEGTTEIGDYSFAGLTDLTSVTIPASVTNVSATAFLGCSNISSVTLPPVDGLSAVFPDSLRAITSVTVSGGTSLPANFAAGCTDLTSVTLPDTLVEIGTSAFAGCDGLTRVNVPSLSSWLGVAFANAAANPLHAGASLYVGGNQLTDLVVPEGTTEIGPYAFAGLEDLTSVTIPSSVTNVDATAFAGCSNVVSVTIGDTDFGVGARAYVLRDFDDGGWTSLGNDQYRSVSIGHNGRTSMSVAVELRENLTLRFRWRVSSESDYDPLIYSVDGNERERISGTGGDWRDVSVPLSAGAHTITWTYSKDSSDNSGDDCGWVDLLSLLQISPRLAYVFPDSYEGIREVTVTGGTLLPADFAAGCTGLTSVTLPETLTEIGTSAFAGCASLSSITIPASVTKIGSSAFAGCASLSSITIPASVTKIGSSAFAGCSNLARVDFATVSGWEVLVRESWLPEGVVVTVAGEELGGSFDDQGFWIVDGWVLDYRDRTAGAVAIPEGVVGIGRGAFAEMYDLARVQFPESLKYIAESAFAGDSYLDDVEIPEGVELIGPEAFRDCSYIQMISFGDGLRTIGDAAFAGCTQLAKVSFARGLVTVGAEAFAGDWRMQSIGLPVTVEAVGAEAFRGCTSLTGVTMPTHGATMGEWFAGVSGQIRNVTIPKGETEIGVNMFSDCTALATISIPEGVTNVAEGAFYNCFRLQTIDLPRTTASVGASAFQGCSALQAVVLPENVETIGARSFQGCSNLRDLTLSRRLTEIPDYAFADCSRLTSFVVPEAVAKLGRNIVASSVTAIYYLGNAPEYDVDVYSGSSWSLTSYVVKDTKGWDGRAQSRDLPASWPVTNSYGRAIAFWTSNGFDVTFDANGGTFLLGGTNTYACAQITDTPYALPPFEPTLGGATFGGYWTERTGGTRVTSSTAVKLTKAHTLYAHWDVAPSMTVRFNANGGTVSPSSQVYTSGEPFGSFPVATREHYNFAGWYSAANGGRRAAISDEAPFADRELFAHWSPKIYEILFHSNNGANQTASQVYTYGDTVTLAANRFACSGCTFAGWSLTPGGKAVYADGKTFADVSAVQDGAIHLYAVWAGRTYAVRFDSNGGYGQMENQTFVLGISQNLSTNVFTRPGYTFAGWAKVSSGVAEYEDGALAVGLTERQNATVDLFAVWERIGVSLAEALGGADVKVSITGAADWIADLETAHDGQAAVRTAGLEPAEEGGQTSTTLTAQIAGSGTGSFWWKVNCEEDYEGEWYDYAVFAIDGVEQARIAGDVAWTKVDYAIAAAGTHTLSWTFYRDDFDEPESDWLNCLWVDELVWNRDISSYTVSDVLNAPELVFTRGGDAQWTADADICHDGVVGMRSGAITHSQQTWIETTVTGRGELSFWWKVSGQVNGSRVYDYAKCELDGVQVARAGLVDWTNLVVAVSNDGPHTIRWTYLKNASTDPEGDCAWLDEVVWTAAKELSVIVPAAISGKADIVIAPAWFAKYPRFVACYGNDLAAAVLKPNGKRGPNGAPGYVWHDYLAGTDPTDEASVFSAKVALDAEGRPVVGWTPELNAEEAAKRRYRTFGKAKLSDAAWSEVVEGHEADFRFFKVTVEMR